MVRWQRSGGLRFTAYSDNSTLIDYYSTANVPFADGAVGGVRVTLDVDNGSGGSTATFHTSTDLGANWSQLGDPVTHGIASFQSAGTTPIEVGSFGNGTGGLSPMQILNAQVRDGINGPLVASPDFLNGQKFFDLQANVCTVNGSSVTWDLAS